MNATSARKDAQHFYAVIIILLYICISAAQSGTGILKLRYQSLKEHVRRGFRLNFFFDFLFEKIDKC